MFGALGSGLLGLTWFTGFRVYIRSRRFRVWVYRVQVLEIRVFWGGCHMAVPNFKYKRFYGTQGNIWDILIGVWEQNRAHLTLLFLVAA